MKRFLLIVALLAGASYGGYELYRYHHRQIMAAKVIGYIEGFKAGDTHGVFTCPCWDREGSFCSMCGIMLTKANAFEIINQD